MEITYDAHQQAVIEATGGHFLVLAPPGCGKTEILAARIAHAYAKGVPFEEMLCLTFTNRASRNMKERVTKNAATDARQLFVGNIHHFCSNFLRQHHLIPENACVIDDDDQADILQYFDDHFFLNYRGLIDRSKIKEIHDLATYIEQRRLGHPLEVCYARKGFEPYYQAAVDAGFDYTKISLADPSKRLRYALQYRHYKQQRTILDFTDLLVLAYEHLRTGEHRRYPWIQIDEVQDLNALQIAIVDELTATDNPTVMYLGDEQQAIFSFLGASLDRLSLLSQRCNGNLLTLVNNYRSPSYLLDVFNTYAEQVLHVSPELLPKPACRQPAPTHSLIVAASPTAEAELTRVVKMAQYYSQFPGERMAVLVSSNAEADQVSDTLALHHIPHFQISGNDIFKSQHFKTFSSLLSVSINPFNNLAWVRLIFGIGATLRLMDARDLAAQLRQLLLTPMDLIEGSSELARFVELYDNSEIVVFDTETTGLDVANDDIVQIAAFIIRQGVKVEGSDFNLILHTDRKIPTYLGDLVNPLVEEYANREHIDRKEGLQQFLDYVGDRPVLGHNVQYDCNILYHNVKRELGLTITLPSYDTLHLIKCVEPTLYRYKLASLIQALGLEGTNSHLANEDIEATLSLANYCVGRTRGVIDEQRAFLSHPKTESIRGRLQVLRPIFKAITAVLESTDSPTLSSTLEITYQSLVAQGLIGDLGPKFDIFLRYVEREWDYADDGLDLKGKIAHHFGGTSTSVTEGDLVNSSDLLTDRIFVMTAHKAKGLEFDNVVILGTNNGRYPSFRVNNVLRSQRSTPEQVSEATAQRNEDARRLYVALTRAKKRICVSYPLHDAQGYDTQLSPFMAPIRPFFQ